MDVGGVAPGQAHAYTRLLYARLLDVAVGETIAYADLSAVIGHDVQDAAYTYLLQARRMALRDDRLVFDVVRDIGLVRVEGRGAIDVADAQRQRVSRAAKRGLDVLGAVDVASLDVNDAHHAHVVRAQLGLARLFTINRTQKKLELERKGSLDWSTIRRQAARLFGSGKEERG